MVACAANARLARASAAPLAAGLTESFAPVEPRFAAMRTAVMVVKGKDP
jgi:hypothetical protein